MFTLYQGGIMDGSFEYMDEYVRTNHIDLTDIESVTVTVNTRDYYISSCQMYDANKNYISHEELEGDDIQSYTFNTSDYPDVKFIAFDFFNNEWSNFEPSEISVDFSVTSNEIIPTLIVAQYKFNKSIDTLPVFNSGFRYAVEDKDNGDGTITRTIGGIAKPTSITFAGCTGLVECGYVALDNVTAMSSMFQGCTSLKVIDSTEWNLSNINTIDTTFYGCSSLVEIKGIEDWDVSNLGADGGTRAVTGTFAECTSLTKLDLREWVINNYVSANSMFTTCTALTELHIPQFNGEVIILAMFQGCTSLTEVHGLENIKTLSAGSNRRTFELCPSLKTVDMSNLDASKATRLDTMFSGCTSLESVDFSNVKLSSTTDFSNMFKDCNSITSVTLKKSSYDVVNKIIAVLPNRTSGSTGTFKITGVDNISQVDITTANSKNWNIDNRYVIAHYKFDNTLYNLIPDFNAEFTNYTCEDKVEGNVTTRIIYSESIPTKIMFGVESGNGGSNDNPRCKSLLEVLYVEGSQLNTLRGMFDWCSQVTYINTEGWDTSRVQDMLNVFHNCYKLEEADVSTWNTSNAIDMKSVFLGCNSLRVIDVSRWDTSKATSTRYMFDNCNSVSELDVSRFNTSNVNTMYAMFSDCYNISSLEVSNFDVRNVTDMSYMFDGKADKGNTVEEYDLSNWQMTSVTKIGGMFHYSRAKRIILPQTINAGLTNITMSNATTGEVFGVFYCPNLEYLDFGGLDLTNVVEDKSYVLQSVPNLKTVRTENAKLISDLAQYFPDRTGNEQGCLITKANVSDEIKAVLNAKNWRVITAPIVTQYKFNNTLYDLFPVFNDGFNYTYEDVVNEGVTTRTVCSEELPTKIIFGIGNGHDPEATDREKSLLEVDYVNIDNITDISYMFNWCTNVTKIDVSNWNTSNVISAYCLFRFCVSLTSLDVSGWNTSNMTNIADMFQECQSLTTIGDVSRWDTSKVTTMAYLFTNCFILNNIDVSNWNTGNVTNMTYMFIECRELTSLDVSRWNTSKVTNMSYMFYSCRKLTSLDVSKWNTSKVTDMSYMFYNCRLLTSLDVSNFDTSQVTIMKYMFYYCESTTSLDVSKWDISNVTNIGGMFECCHSLISLDVSKWNTSNIKLAWYVFTQCWELTELDVSKWNTSKVTDMSHMFHNCNKLTSLDVSNFDTSQVTDMSSMFGYCTKLKNLNISNFIMDNVTNVTDMFIRTDVLDNIIMSNSDYNSVNKVIAQLPTNETKKVMYTFNCNNVNLLDKETVDSKNWKICIQGSQIIDVKGNSNKYKNIKIGNARVKRIHIGEIYL